MLNKKKSKYYQARILAGPAWTGSKRRNTQDQTGQAGTCRTMLELTGTGHAGTGIGTGGICRIRTDRQDHAGTDMNNQEKAEHAGTGRNSRNMQDRNGRAGPRRNKHEYSGTTRITQEQAGTRMTSPDRQEHGEHAIAGQTGMQ
jgi:hypothetical protein